MDWDAADDAAALLPSRDDSAVDLTEGADEHDDGDADDFGVKVVTLADGNADLGTDGLEDGVGADLDADEQRAVAREERARQRDELAEFDLEDAVRDLDGLTLAPESRAGRRHVVEREDE